MIVSTSAARSFDLVDHVGVAIMSRPGQLHSAFLYQVDDASPKLVHLGWHYVLIRGDPGDHYMWADVEELVVEDRRYLASYLSIIGGNDPHIPYGLNSEGIEFDPVTGELRSHPNGSGVTCATFMLAVLKALGHVVIDPTDWPTDRPGDKEWQNLIVEMLEPDYPEHAAAVRQDLPCVRFRPEEVVGATATKGWPHNFDAAETAGKEVLDDIATAGKWRGNMASKELELTPNVYIFAGVGALLLGGLGAWAFSGTVSGIISSGVVGGLAGGILGLFF